MDNSFNTQQMEVREVFDRLMKGINTATPGRIIDFDPDNQTCSVKPAIKPRIFGPDGSVTDIDPVEIKLAPLVFPFSVGAGFALTLPVQAGDPCLIIFSQRCIDNWWVNGGIQSAETGAIGARHHDYSDALVIPCGGPLPNVLGGWCSDGIEIRNRSRSVRFTLKDDAIEVDGPVTFKAAVTFDTTAHVKGAVTLDSTLQTSGDATFSGKLTDKNGIDHTTHKHTGVQTGTGTSGGPTT